MNLQKAMRIRSELKKEAALLSIRIGECNYTIDFETEDAEYQVDGKALDEKRNEKLKALDGLTYIEAVKKQFRYNEVLYELNLAIDEANEGGQKLLLKETMLKSKLAQIDALLNRERRITPVTTDNRITGRSENGHEDYQKIYIHSFSVLSENALGMSLIDFKKKIVNELEDVRDQLAAYNSTHEVNYEIPKDLI